MTLKKEIERKTKDFESDETLVFYIGYELLAMSAVSFVTQYN